MVCFGCGLVLCLRLFFSIIIYDWNVRMLPDDGIIANKSAHLYQLQRYWPDILGRFWWGSGEHSFPSCGTVLF